MKLSGVRAAVGPSTETPRSRSWRQRTAIFECHRKQEGGQNFQRVRRRGGNVVLRSLWTPRRRTPGSSKETSVGKLLQKYPGDRSQRYEEAPWGGFLPRSPLLVVKMAEHVNFSGTCIYSNICAYLETLKKKKKKKFLKNKQIIFLINKIIYIFN